MRDTAGSAAAPAARWRNLRRGSFIVPPVASSAKISAHSTAAASTTRRRLTPRVRSPDLAQLGRTAQRVVDARLPARSGGAKVLDHVRVDPQLQCLLGIVRRRPTATDQPVAMIKIGALEHLIRPFRRVGEVNPSVRASLA